MPYNTERAKKMYALKAAGVSLLEIGVTYGVTRERVRQIIARWCNDAKLPAPKLKRDKFVTVTCGECGAPLSRSRWSRSKKFLCPIHRAKYRNDDGSVMSASEKRRFRYATDPEFRKSVAENTRKHRNSLK